MTNRSVRESDAHSIRNLVRLSDQNVNPHTVQVFNFLIQSKRLKPSIEEGYEAHPSVIEGLESLLDSRPEVAEDVIIAILKGCILQKQTGETFRIISEAGGAKASYSDFCTSCY